MNARHDIGTERNTDPSVFPLTAIDCTASSRIVDVVSDSRGKATSRSVPTEAVTSHTAAGSKYHGHDVTNVVSQSYRKAEAKDGLRAAVNGI